MARFCLYFLFHLDRTIVRSFKSGFSLHLPAFFYVIPLCAFNFASDFCFVSLSLPLSLYWMVPLSLRVCSFTTSFCFSVWSIPKLVNASYGFSMMNYGYSATMIAWSSTTSCSWSWTLTTDHYDYLAFPSKHINATVTFSSSRVWFSSKYISTL